MPNSISPYALLCASKPKSAPSIVTAYDLYSAAQQPTVHEKALSPTPADYASRKSQPLPYSSASASSRTHYIADIQRRHRQAIQKTSLK